MVESIQMRRLYNIIGAKTPIPTIPKVKEFEENVARIKQTRAAKQQQTTPRVKTVGSR